MGSTRPTETPKPSRRRWRIAGISHATVVAYLALFMAMGGTAFAATGGTFILGKSNKADQVTTLTSTTSSALSLKSPAGKAPLAVNRNVMVKNLNADLLDGYHATGLARLGKTNTGARTTIANPDGIPLRLTPKAGSAPLQTASKVKVANLNADLLDGLDSTAFVPKTTFDALKKDHTTLQAQQAALRTELDALKAKVAEYDALLAGMTRVTVDGEPTLRIAGVNVQIVNGTGRTDISNGRGNLIVGYSAQRDAAAERFGSHYLVIGDKHEWTSYGGILAGDSNTATGRHASVLGGRNGTASGLVSVVVGGNENRASGFMSSVTGGAKNVASGVSSAVSGGFDNLASAYHATVAGGDLNEAGGHQSTVLGGKRNSTTGEASSILGGDNNHVDGTMACHPTCS